MQKLNSHAHWCKRLFIPIIFLVAASVLWGVGVNMIMYRSLGVELAEVDGHPPTIFDFFEIYGLDSGVLIVLVNLVFLLTMLMLKRQFRWWVILAAIVLVGTPISVFTGRAITEYLWGLNRGGIPWEDVLPPGIGVGIAWVVGLFTDSCLDWISRTSRQQKSTDFEDL